MSNLYPIPIYHFKYSKVQFFKYTYFNMCYISNKKCHLNSSEPLIDQIWFDKPRICNYSNIFTVQSKI